MLPGQKREARSGDPEVSKEVQARIELYLRAERPVRELFSTYFGKLCTVCGQLSAETGEHLCCCIGVRCLEHLAASPVLSELLARSEANSSTAAALRARGQHSLLGQSGCRLDWGRPPACNVCICTPERNCLLAVLSPGQVVSFCRALRVFHLAAQPELRNLSTLETAVEHLEHRVEQVREAIERDRTAFDTAVERAIAGLRTRGVPRPEF